MLDQNTSGKEKNLILGESTSEDETTVHLKTIGEALRRGVSHRLCF